MSNFSSFYTDVIATDPRFATVKRVADVALLEPVFRAAVAQIVADAAARSVALMVFETYRSKQRQLQLFAEGASKLQTVGVHHFGLAADLVRIVDGEPSWKGDFDIVGELAHEHGLVWGGDWHTFHDPYHVQRCSLHDQPRLFHGDWYPAEDYVAAP